MAKSGKSNPGGKSGTGSGSDDGGVDNSGTDNSGKDAGKPKSSTRDTMSVMHEAMRAANSWTGKSDNKQEEGDPRTLSLAPETSETASRFVGLMETSIRRWERIVYPTLLILFLMFGLAAFLVYELSSDMRVISRGFDPKMGDHMERLTLQMERLSDNITVMTKHTSEMSNHVASMSRNTEYMTKQMAHLATMAEIKSEMQHMNRAISVMTQDMGMMRHNVAGMNRSVAKPMNFINSFMPW